MKPNTVFYKIYYKVCSFEKRAQLLRQQGAKIGQKCQIYPDVSLGSEPYLVEIGDRVRITSGCRLTTHDGGMFVLRNLKSDMKDADKFGKIVIGSNCHIGVGATLMPGITVGSNVIIGAGAVVTKDIPSDSVAVGVPAKVIESIEDYYLKNRDKTVSTKNMSPQEKKDFVIANVK